MRGRKRDKDRDIETRYRKETIGSAGFDLGEESGREAAASKLIVNYNHHPM